MRPVRPTPSLLLPSLCVANEIRTTRALYPRLIHPGFTLLLLLPPAAAFYKFMIAVIV